MIDLLPSNVTVAGLVVPEIEPLQLMNALFVAAVAVKVTTVPGLYLPPEQFGVGLTSTLPGPVVDKTSEKHSVKFTVTALSPFIVTFVGLEEGLLTDPLHELKIYPVDGKAVSDTNVPDW